MTPAGLQISPLAALILGAAVSTLASIFASYVASSRATTRNAAKFEGAILARIEAHDGKFKEIALAQDQQWSKINQTSQKVAGIEGKLDVIKIGKAHHA